MTIAALHLLSSNTGRLRQPMIFLSQISLSPTPLSVSSFCLSLSLCCLWCATLANQVEHRSRSEIRSAAVWKLIKPSICPAEYAQRHDIVVPQPQGTMVCTASDDSKSCIKRKRNDFAEYPNKKFKHAGHEAAGQMSNQPKEASAQLEWKDRGTEPNGDFTVNVGLQIMADGEFVLKIKRIIPSSTDEDEVERAKQMAQSAGMLFLQAEMLRDMGEKLLARSQASFQSVFGKPASSKSEE